MDDPLICAPVVVPVYDRCEHLKRCLASLQANALAKDTELYIVSDAAYREIDKPKIQIVRDYAKTVTGFKKVHLLFREQNLGESVSVRKAFEELYQWSDRLIFIEDDIVVSPNFLQYMNDGLTYYRDDPKCLFVCGFRAMFDLPKHYDKEVYFYPSLSPWGYGTWREKEQQVDLSYFDRYAELRRDRSEYRRFLSIGFYIKGILMADSRKEIVADDMRNYYYMFKHRMYAVFPTVSKTQNIGFDGSGLHCGDQNYHWAMPTLDQRGLPTHFIPFTGYDKQLLKNHRRFMDKINGGVIAKYLKYTWVHRLWKQIKKHI